jgi:polysaccharide deacetylase family protein (PEP-CTERM system associated)
MPVNDQGPSVVSGLSVDVEDYYQVWAFEDVIRREDWPTYPSRVEANTRRTLELFADARVTGTFFVLGCIAKRHPRLIKEIVAAGHELASHGFDHFPIYRQTATEFREDVRSTRLLLEDLGGVPVRGYRAANFSIDSHTLWAFDILAESGYRYSSSVNPIRHDHYGMRDAPRFPFHPTGAAILEIPISTVELSGFRIPCGGGGWFRLLPYGLSYRALKRLTVRECRPAVFYFHPWEIDPEQPRISHASLRSRFRHYANLGAMQRKLRRLLADFTWARLDRIFLATEREGHAEGDERHFIS